VFHDCQKKFEHPPNRVVYYSMNNFAGCIEGATVNTGASDLKSRNSERFDARLHGAGINDEENAGRYSNTDERHIGRQRFGLSLRTVGATSWSGDSKVYWPVSAPYNTAPHCYRNHGNPYIGKGMHTRSQQIFFGGGETRMQMRSFANLGRLTKCATPPPISL
jgi:hypothetical protein